MSKLIRIGKSKIHGTGVFAGVTLPARLHFPIEYTVQPDAHDSFEGWLPEKPFCYLNHSSRPNSEAVSDDNDLYLVLLRSVRPGTELTINYGDQYWKTK